MDTLNSSMDGSENLRIWSGEMEESTLSNSTAVVSCITMTFFYVAILYAPTLILRLPPPPSFKTYMIRRFICAAVSSLASLFLCALILPINRRDVKSVFSVYGIRTDHTWQALLFPLSLTSLMYAGSIVQKSLMLLYSWKDKWSNGDDNSFISINSALRTSMNWIASIASDVSAWRNYFVAPLTEEVVFRACMIPLLLCGGFKTYTVIFLCPVFFSLAHLNHLLEFYAQYNGSLARAAVAVGFQLGYTVIFGSYASFLFVRTGHLTAPLIAHIFCNFMGLPTMLSRRTGIVGITFLAGMVGFLWLLFPLTTPYLYNDTTDSCKCWQRYCTWN